MTEIPLPFGFTELKSKGSVLKFMALNAWVKQQVTCGLSEIGLQLEFQWGTVFHILMDLAFISLNLVINTCMAIE